MADDGLALVAGVQGIEDECASNCGGLLPTRRRRRRATAQSFTASVDDDLLISDRY